MSEEQKRRWIRDQLDRFVFPNFMDPNEAVRAFDFFDGSTFSDQRVRYLLTYDVLKRNFDFKDKSVAETGHLSGYSHWLRKKILM
jgi:hypothetical protein